MPKVAGQRVVESDVNKVPGAKGSGKEAGQKAEPKGRATGRNDKSSGSSGHDGVQGPRGGTRV